MMATAAVSAFRIFINLEQATNGQHCQHAIGWHPINIPRDYKAAPSGDSALTITRGQLFPTQCLPPSRPPSIHPFSPFYAQRITQQILKSEGKTHPERARLHSRIQTRPCSYLRRLRPGATDAGEGRWGAGLPI